jgi:hypothetical protein
MHSDVKPDHAMIAAFGLATATLNEAHAQGQSQNKFRACEPSGPRSVSEFNQLKPSLLFFFYELALSKNLINVQASLQLKIVQQLVNLGLGHRPVSPGPP